jgi:hypothetical protein
MCAKAPIQNQSLGENSYHDKAWGLCTSTARQHPQPSPSMLRRITSPGEENTHQAVLHGYALWRNMMPV